MIIARYFLADQLLRLGYNERALVVLSPSISHAPFNWLTRPEEAHILHALGRKLKAKAAADLAVAHAPTSEKAEQLQQSLKDIFGAIDT